jgi:hypothetical protein
MNTIWEVSYLEMHNQISKCWSMAEGEIKRVECAFKIVIDSWTEVKNKFKEYQFADKHEEIRFFKTVKPKFTTYIEYFILLNHSLLFFNPDSSKESERMYWEHELKRLAKFEERNKSFVGYYRSGSNQHDQQYFLQENYDLAHFIVNKLYDSDGELMTSHDHLIAMLAAEEMYHEYVKNKLRIKNKEL